MQQQSHETAAMSPQEAQKYRATAQQNSIDAIRAAEERYAKAKQSGSAALYETKEAVGHGLGATTTYLAGKGSQAAGYTAEMGKQGVEATKNAALTAGQKASSLANEAAAKTKDASLYAGGYAAEKGKQGFEDAKDTTFTVGQKAAEVAKQAAAKTKETSLSAAGYTTEKVRQGYEAAKDTALTTSDKAAELAKQAKDTSLSAAQLAARNTEQTAVKAKEAAVAAGGTAQDYVLTAGEKAKMLASETAKSSKGRTEEADKKAAETTAEKTSNAEENLGEQSEEAKQRLLSISMEERGGIEGQEEKKWQQKGREKTTTAGKRETVEGNTARKRVVVKELEPEIEVSGTGGEQSKSGAGGMFEAVGAAVIEAAEIAREAVFGKEQGK